MRMDFYQIIVSSQTNTKTFFSGREGGEEKNRDAQIASKSVIK